MGGLFFQGRKCSDHTPPGETIIPEATPLIRLSFQRERKGEGERNRVSRKTFSNSNHQHTGQRVCVCVYIYEKRGGGIGHDDDGLIPPTVVAALRCTRVKNRTIFISFFYFLYFILITTATATPRVSPTFDFNY